MESLASIKSRAHPGKALQVRIAYSGKTPPRIVYLTQEDYQEFEIPSGAICTIQEVSDPNYQE